MRPISPQSLRQFDDIKLKQIENVKEIVIPFSLYRLFSLLNQMKFPFCRSRYSSDSERFRAIQGFKIKARKLCLQRKILPNKMLENLSVNKILLQMTFDFGFS